MEQCSSFSTSLLSSVSPEFLILDILTSVRWNLRVVLICVSLITKCAEHFIRCFAAILSFPSWEFSVYLCTPFLIGLLDSLESIFFCSLYMLDISPLSDVRLIKIFSQSLGCPLCPIDSVLCITETWQFYEVWFLNSCSESINHGVLFRKISPMSMCSRLFPTFSSISFSVSGFMGRSLIHVDLSFAQGDKNGSISIFLHADLQFDSWTSTIC